LTSERKNIFCDGLDKLLPIGYNATMRTNEHKTAAAQLGLEWSAVLAIYREARELEAGEVARVAAIRKAAAAFMGYGHAGQFKLAKRSAMTIGDASQLKGFDVCAASMAETMSADITAAGLYDLLAADAPTMSPADDAMRAAIDRAAQLKTESDNMPADAGDWIGLVSAAAAADVTEQWLRQLVKAGRIRGRKFGRNWKVSAADVAFFTRHPTMGRPRLESVPF
jgi:hypothetical protein